MLLTKDYYRIAFENRLRTNQLGDVDDYNLKLAKLKNNSYPLPYSFKGDYTEHLTHENLFRRFGTVIHTEIEEGTVVCMDVMPEPEIVDENQSYPSPHEMRYPCLRCRSHKLAMLGKIPCSFVDDTRFDLAGYVYREFGHYFGRAEENICLNGIGQTEPKGLLHSAEIGVTASTLTADAVIELFFSLDKQYRRNAVWVMNDETAMTLRMLKDSAGNFLWRNTDDTIFSHTVVISNYINDSTIVFGNLSYYWLIERQPLAVRPLNELYAQESCLGLAASERIDGKLVRSEAVKLFKLN
ncbi:phage major capsid protein [Ruminococcus callidus]|uniref:phage major capsid protein n=1 Tax=Ruminococcus callidus TaxID=40519 RepID=UPI0039A28A75